MAVAFPVAVEVIESRAEVVLSARPSSRPTDGDTTAVADPDPFASIGRVRLLGSARRGHARFQRLESTFVDEGSYGLRNHPRTTYPTPALGDSDIELNHHLDGKENLEATLAFWDSLFRRIQRHVPKVSGNVVYR